MATIQKRRGHYRVLVRRKGHPVQSATFTKINDTRKWAQSIEAAITERRHLKPPPVRCTLSDLIDRYIREVLPHKRASTRPNQTRHLRWWKQQLGYKEAADVTPSILAEHRDELAQRVSGAPVNRYLAALSHAFTVAVKEWGWLDANPCRKLRRRPEPRGRVRYLSDTERERLLTACRASRSPHLYVVVVLALSTGARKGELLGLTWRHVDLDKGRITLEDTKNGNRRVILLTGHAPAGRGNRRCHVSLTSVRREWGWLEGTPWVK